MAILLHLVIWQTGTGVYAGCSSVHFQNTLPVHGSASCCTMLLVPLQKRNPLMFLHISA